jgi:thiol:disulfide interchange protein DsbD
MRFLSALLILLAVALAAPARAAEVVTTPRVEARLVSEVKDITASGGVISVGLHLKMQPGWHTYWRNPGESGEATTIAWTLPKGFVASDIIWPYPERIPFGELANYGFSDEITLRVELTVPKGLRSGESVTLKADVAWLVCKDICIPEKGTLELTLPVLDEVLVFNFNEQRENPFDKVRAREPVKSDSFNARFAATASDVTLYFEPTLSGMGLGSSAQFFPFTKGLLKASAPQTAEARGGGFAITVPPGWRLRDAERRQSTETIDGVLVIPAIEGAAAQAYELTLQRGRPAARRSNPLRHSRRPDPEPDAVRLPDPVDEGARPRPSRPHGTSVDGRYCVPPRRARHIRGPRRRAALVARHGRRRRLGLPTPIAALRRDPRLHPDARRPESLRRL